TPSEVASRPCRSRQVARAISVVSAGSSFWLCSNASQASTILLAATSARPLLYSSSAWLAAGCARAGVTAPMRETAMMTLLEITRVETLDRRPGRIKRSERALGAPSVGKRHRAQHANLNEIAGGAVDLGIDGDALVARRPVLRALDRRAV